MEQPEHDEEMKVAPTTVTNLDANDTTLSMSQDDNDDDALPAKVAKKEEAQTATEGQPTTTAGKKAGGKKAAAEKKAGAKKAASAKQKAPKSFELVQNGCEASYCEQFLFPLGDGSGVFSENGFHDATNQFRENEDFTGALATGGTIAVLFNRSTKVLRILNMRPAGGEEPRTLFETTIESDNAIHNPSSAVLSRDGSKVAILFRLKRQLLHGAVGDAQCDLSTLNLSGSDINLDRDAVFVELPPATTDSDDSRATQIIISSGAILDLGTGVVSPPSGSIPKSGRLWHFTNKETGATAIRFVGYNTTRQKATISVREVTGLDQPTIAGIGGKIISEFNVNFPEMCSMAVDHDTGYCAMGGCASPKFYVYDLTAPVKRGKIIGRIDKLGDTIWIRYDLGSKWQTFCIAALPAVQGVRDYPAWIAINTNNADDPTMDCIEMKPSTFTVKPPVSARTEKKQRRELGGWGGMYGEDSDDVDDDDFW